MKDKRILVIGAGALGSAFLEMTAGAFRKVGIFDGDIITEDNLVNQPFYGACSFSVPESKAGFASRRMREIGGPTEYIAYEKYFTAEDIHVLEGYDFVLDFTDTVRSRRVINGCCARTGKSAVFSSMNSRQGMVYFFGKNSACFNCILRNSIGKVKEGCESRILSLDEGFMDFLTKKISGFISGSPEEGKLYSFSFSDGRSSAADVQKDADCGACSQKREISTGGKFVQICSAGIKFSAGREVDLDDIAGRLAGSRMAGSYLLRSEGRRSVLVSRDGDILLTGYGRGEAEGLILSLLGAHPEKKNNAGNNKKGSRR